MQERLFETENISDLDNSEILLFRSYFSQTEADEYFSLLHNVGWYRNEIIVYGKKHLEPRDTAWYGDPGLHYKYSELEHKAKPWLPFLIKIRDQVNSAFCQNFNSVLINRYRDGNDGVSWHSDDEPELGNSPTLCSVSFGGSRKFQLRSKEKPREIFSIYLTHGDLLIMKPPTQQNWLHAVPKTNRKVTERINLTFREIIA